MPRSYAIIGTGALGGFYGARLQRAGCELHFLLHSDYEHVRQHGLVCESKDGDFTLPKVNAYSDVRDMPKCDVVCVCLKTTQNHLLPQLLLGKLAHLCQFLNFVLAQFHLEKTYYNNVGILI